MIKTIEVLFYKGFKHAKVELEPYNILVGPNASGKSSFFDVLNFVRDMLNEGAVSAVEKRSSYCQQYEIARYEIALTQNETDGIVIENEQLWLIKEENGGHWHGDKQIFSFPSEPEEPAHIIRSPGKSPPGWRKVVSKTGEGNDYFRSETTEWDITYRLGPQKAALARIPEDDSRFPVSLWVKNVLTEGIEFIRLNSVNMRRACRPDAPVHFEPAGSNLPKVIKHLEKNHPAAFARWAEHVRTAFPDIRTIQIRERPEDRHLCLSAAYHNETEIPSWLLSDGTLRLLAQTLVAYLPVTDKMLFQDG